MCCGSFNKTTSQRTTINQSKGAAPGRLNDILLKNTAGVPVQAIGHSGRRYFFSQSGKQQQLVDPRDADTLMKTGMFRKAD